MLFHALTLKVERRKSCKDLPFQGDVNAKIGILYCNRFYVPGKLRSDSGQ